MNTHNVQLSVNTIGSATFKDLKMNTHDSGNPVSNGYDSPITVSSLIVL